MSEAKKQARRPQTAQRKRRGGNRVPMALVIILLVLALAMGGLGGFAVARKTDGSRAELEQVRAKNIELENILTAIGFNVGEDDPETWGESGDDDGLSAISSDDGGDDDVSIWDDQGILSGLMSEDQDPVVVAEYDGGQLMSTDFIPVYNDALSTAIFNGSDVDDASGALLQEVLASEVGQRLKQAEAQKLGMDTLTDAEAAEAEAGAKQEYEENIRGILDAVTEEGMSAEEARSAAETFLAESEGITLETVTAEYKAEALEKKYRDHVVKDVNVTDEDVKAHYDDLLADQQADFSEVPDDFFYSHLYGSVVVYNPEGFRAVRDVQISFDNPDDGDTVDELMAQLEVVDMDSQGDTYDALNEQLTALFAPLETRAQEAVEKLNGGAEFTALMDEYGCSDYLKDEPLRSQGYYISSESQLNSAEFIQGAMELEQPGEVSVPVRSPLGLHLIQYIGDVTPGAVPFESVKDAVRADLLEIRQDEFYEDYVSSLLSEANVKYYPERLQ